MHIRLNRPSWCVCVEPTSIKSYLMLISNGVAHMNKQLWRLKVQLKIKIFMWYMRREVVLTKDNLVR
jgi:hypothetical protein